MIINPIIPIWLMSIISIILFIIVLFWNKIIRNIVKEKDKTKRQKKLIKKYLFSIFIKTLIIINLFIINLRIMVVDKGISQNIVSNVDVLFVIDTTISMKAEDYNGKKTRLEGIYKDTEYIIENLAGANFSVIEFNNSAKVLLPFVDDPDLVISEIYALDAPDEFYATGSSLNIVKETLKEVLEKEKEKENTVIVFFISDGEITSKKDNKLKSFSDLKQYIDGGAVLGYGTTKGGKMENYILDGEKKYIIDWTTYPSKDALSRIDEKNLKQLANDLGIDYIKMDKTSNIDSKLRKIEKTAKTEVVGEKKIEFYNDTYYLYSIPLIILLMINFIYDKRRM